MGRGEAQIIEAALSFTKQSLPKYEVPVVKQDDTALDAKIARVQAASRREREEAAQAQAKGATTMSLPVSEPIVVDADTELAKKIKRLQDESRKQRG
jgi:hypothetical protein